MLSLGRIVINAAILGRGISGSARAAKESPDTPDRNPCCPLARLSVSLVGQGRLVRSGELSPRS
jgi:hypothetical protein